MGTCKVFDNDLQLHIYAYTQNLAIEIYSQKGTGEPLMCLPLDDTAMICWLKTQVRVIEAWREELASRPEIDIPAITRLETHYQWLSFEVTRLEDPTSRQAA